MARPPRNTKADDSGSRALTHDLSAYDAAYVAAAAAAGAQLVSCDVRDLVSKALAQLPAQAAPSPVVLTVHGRPVADIVPRQERAERRPTERLLADLAQLSELAARSGVESPAEDFDVGWTTDDLSR